MRKRSYKTQKKYAWAAFSKYIRLRDSIGGYCECISCGVRRYWEKDGMQAGHLISGRTNNILFDEEIVHAQCAECNNNSGEQVAFWMGLKIKYEYKDRNFEEFKIRKNIIKKFKQWELEQIEEEYTDRANDILAGIELTL